MAQTRETPSEFAGYRLEELLGEGGMGVVYRATHLESGDEVAIKLIAQQFAGDLLFRKRFEREARLSAMVDHPHAIPVYESGEHEGTLFLSMPFVRGVDLAALIESRGALHPAQAAEIVSQVAGALDAASEHGLIHRDVKPGNILIEMREGRPHAFLMDFGLSKSVSSQSGLTKTGQWLGTLDYAAPEQLQSEDCDARTDVYALGGVLYRALTGEMPYPRQTDVEKMTAHIVEPPPQVSSAPGVPAEFDEIVSRAMAKSPDDRYPTAGELGTAAVAAAESAGPPPEEPLFTAAPARLSDDDAPTRLEGAPPPPSPDDERTRLE